MFDPSTGGALPIAIRPWAIARTVLPPNITARGTGVACARQSRSIQRQNAAQFHPGSADRPSNTGHPSCKKRD